MITGQGEPTALVEQEHEKDLNTKPAPPSSPMRKKLKAEASEMEGRLRAVMCRLEFAHTGRKSRNAGHSDSATKFFI
jgi:hypothetical protein